MAFQVIRDSLRQVQGISSSFYVSRNKTVACHRLPRTGPLFVVTDIECICQWT